MSSPAPEGKLDVLRDLAFNDMLTIRGLQHAYNTASAAVNDASASPRIRADAEWLREQLGAELLVRELDGSEATS